MQTIHIDISNKSVLPTIYAKQGEIGRKFEIILRDSGTPYNVPEDALLSAWYDGESGDGNYTEIGERSAFTVENNRIVVELITQMLTNPGEGVLCLVMNDSEKQIGVWNIPYLCEETPGFDSEGAKSYYTAFSEAVDKIKDPDKTLSVSGVAADAKVTGDTLSKKVPTTRKVNGKELSSDINLTASDVGAAPAGKTIKQGLGTHGWYRVGVLYVGHQEGHTAIAQMAIGGWYNEQNAKPAIIDIAFDLGGGYLHKVFNTVIGTHITSVRLCRIDNSRVAIDVYYGGSGANTVYVTVYEIQGVFTANSTFVDVSANTESVIATLNMTKAQTTQIDLLWVNATPGVSFPAQTIPLDLSRYDCVEVVASAGELPAVFFGSTKVPIGQSGFTCGFGSDYWFHSRNFAVSATGIAFQSGYMRDPDGKVYENWDGRSVPYKIYGIKEGQ